MSAANAAGQVADYIRDAITEGLFRAGERIDLAWLTEQLNVSRTPVREALVQLESEGLLESLPSRATIVRRVSMRRVEELFAARIPIEGTLAAVGARHVDDDDVDQLARLFDEMLGEDDPDRGRELVALHIRFLLVVYRAARSDGLLRIAHPLVVQSAGLQRHFNYADHEHVRRSGHVRWGEMFEACRAHDGDACEQTLRLHLVESAAAILALERTADDVEYLSSVLRPAEMRAYRTMFTSRHRWARRVES